MLAFKVKTGSRINARHVMPLLPVLEVLRAFLASVNDFDFIFSSLLIFVKLWFHILCISCPLVSIVSVISNDMVSSLFLWMHKLIIFVLLNLLSIFLGLLFSRLLKFTISTSSLSRAFT